MQQRPTAYTGSGRIGILALPFFVVLGQRALLLHVAAAARSFSPSRPSCFLGRAARPHWGLLPGPRTPSIMVAGAKSKAQEASASLPDDPAQLKLLVSLRETELRATKLELQVKELELAAAARERQEAAKERQEAATELAECRTRVTMLELEKLRLEERASVNQRIPLVEYVGYGAMIKSLEYAKSPLRRRKGAKAPRAAVWEDVFTRDTFFFESVLEKVDFGEQAKGKTDKEMIQVAAERMNELYQAFYRHMQRNCVDPPVFRYWGAVDGNHDLLIVVCTQFSMTYEEWNRYDMEFTLAPEVEWLLKPDEEEIYPERFKDKKGGKGKKAGSSKTTTTTTTRGRRRRSTDEADGSDGSGESGADGSGSDGSDETDDAKEK